MKLLDKFRVPRKVHDLKCWPESFAAVLDGRKTVEIRLNDRDYQAGDRLILREYIPSEANASAGPFTGRACAVEVTHVLAGGQFGLDHDYVALSVRLE